jgi:hypothetical protein
MTPDTEHPAASHDKPVEIVVDDQPVTAPDKVETAHQILDLVSKAITDFYLVLKRGPRDRVSYKDTPEEPIRLHKGMEFITVPIGPTPVS